MSYLHYATRLSTIHVLAYSTCLGTNVFQTFLVGPIAYSTLPRQQFGNLQARLTPSFFGLQAITATICVAASYYSTSGTYNELIAMSGVAAINLLNLAILGPMTTKMMMERHKLERSSGQKYTDPEVSPEMAKITRDFNIMHSISASINLLGLLGLLAHAVHLGHKLDLLEPI